MKSLAALALVIALASTGAAQAATMLSDRQMDTVTAGDFTADATAQAFGAVTATSTLTSIFPSTLNGNPVTGSMSTASASSYSPP